MQAVSPRYLAAWRGSGAGRAHQVSVNVRGTGWVVVPHSTFQVTAARGERVVARYSGTVVFPPGVLPIDPYGSYVRCASGFVIDGVAQWCTIATLRVEDVEADEFGAQTVNGFSAERAVEVAGFETPPVYDAGYGVASIVALLSVVPLPVTVTTTLDRPVPQAVFDTSSSRWDTVLYYATALSVDVYADPSGGFVIANQPTISNQPVVTLDSGGVVVTRQRKLSRTGVPSVVVVEGNRTNTTTPAPRGVARDANPFSPTYYMGNFGRQQKYVNSPLMMDNVQCTLAAQTILAQNQGLARSLTLTAVPMDFVEPGDVATVVFPDGTKELHIIDSLTHSSDDPPQSLQTRTTGAGST